MSERRVAPRQVSLVFYDIVHAGTGERFGDLLDLSSTGLLARCEQPVAPGTRLSLQMDIAARMLGTRTVNFEAECRWCSRLDAEGFDCGLAVRPAAGEVRYIPHLAATMVFDAPRAF